MNLNVCKNEIISNTVIIFSIGGGYYSLGN